MKREHPKMKFPSIADVLKYQQDNVTVSKWIQQRNNYVLLQNHVPCDWSKQGLFMIEGTELEIRGQPGFRLKVLVN